MDTTYTTERAGTRNTTANWIQTEDEALGHVNARLAGLVREYPERDEGITLGMIMQNVAVAEAHAAHLIINLDSCPRWDQIAQVAASIARATWSDLLNLDGEMDENSMIRWVRNRIRHRLGRV